MKIIPAALKAAAQQQVDHLLASSDGIQAAVVATSDGFDVAAAMRSSLSVERIAALSSSIAAIGEVVSVETHLGTHRSIIVNADDGYAVLCSAHRPDFNLVLSIVASSDALLGSINYLANASSKALESFVVPTSS